MKYALLAVLLLAAAPVMAALTHGSDYSNPANQFPIRTNSAGQLTQTLQAGEDQTNDVQKVEERFSYSTGATIDTVVKASAGFLHSVTCGSDTAATAGTLAIRDATSAGTGTIVFTWTFSATEIQPQTLIFDAVMATGIVLDFTTTADVTCTASYR